MCFGLKTLYQNNKAVYISKRSLFFSSTDIPRQLLANAYFTNLALQQAIGLKPGSGKSVHALYQFNRLAVDVINSAVRWRETKLPASTEELLLSITRGVSYLGSKNLF